ncbi:IS66-like element accessory protein TnpA [Sphingobium sp. YR768]|uniref:IS66-like element accessory protein TnpA n=1 Tax=Sphingobium sp. YR768 TaxID=1884365 RepID=UPI0008BA9CB4|nr:transposase [Sphingobium sp. YR768]SER54084.1 transposase [Sphingobium sp. YR768]
MGRIEVITRTERRRKYSPAERDAIMREADAPDVTVREVAKRHDIAESLIYSWRTARRQAEKIASEPLTFISYGTVPQGAVATVPPAPPPARSDAVPAIPAIAEELVRPHPGVRPGEIGIDLPSGVRLSVDSYVNEKALARVLRTLRDIS